MSRIFRHSDGSLRDYPEDLLQFDKAYKNSPEPKHQLDPENEKGKKDALNDPTKPRLSLIPKSALWALGGALTYGEKHYGTHNWRKGIPVSVLLDAAMRHIVQFANGEDIDEKSQNHHLGNAMANLAMAVEMTNIKPNMDDRHEKKID